MKPVKKTQKKLDARINDYRKSADAMHTQDAKGFRCPGSRKKIY